MSKLVSVLYFIFVITPISFFCGLGIILVDNKTVCNFQFECKNIKKKKRQIDKEKFAKFMKRVCK